MYHVSMNWCAYSLQMQKVRKGCLVKPSTYASEQLTADKKKVLPSILLSLQARETQGYAAVYQETG